MPLTNKTFLRGALFFVGAGLLILIGIVVAAITLASRTSDLNAELRQARSDRAITMDVLQSLLNVETGQRGYLLTRDPMYLRPFEAARPRLPGELNALRAAGKRLGFSPEQVTLLTATAQGKLEELTHTIELARTGRRDAAIAAVRSNRGLALMDNARRMLNEVSSAADRRVDANLAATSANSEELRVITEVGGALIVLFGFGALLLAVRYTKELHKARAEVAELNIGLEERVAERTLSLSRANEEIQRFAYIVSHDLRAPLVNIMGFTSELEVGLQTLRQYVALEKPNEELTTQVRAVTGQELPEAVRFIRSSTAKMDGLIKAILKLSREGRRNLASEQVDLGQLVSNAAATLQHQADESGASIEISGRLPVLISDRLALEQVFSNLLDNALKYLAPGRPGRIVVSAKNARQRVVISVRDNGRGIAEQDRERVFDLFRRAGAQDKPGEGIGLAHVRALVRRLGGDIALESRLGEGSEFRIELPRILPVQASSAT